MGHHYRPPTDNHGLDHVVTFDIETIVDDQPEDGSFPPWPMHRPVAAAFLKADWRTPGCYEFNLQTLICTPDDEREFLEQVNALLPVGVTGVSYNGRGFDLPVLQLRAMITGCFDLEGLSNQSHAQRFGRDHCDLLDQFSAYGATKKVSLAELCGPLGIPVKTSTCGSEVGDLWRAGNIEAIARYVEEDVIATYILWLFKSAFRNNDESRIVVPLSDLTRWIERSPELAHLAPFTTCRPANWARSRAVLHAVQSALDHAERRVRVAADDRAFSGEPPIF